MGDAVEGGAGGAGGEGAALAAVVPSPSYLWECLRLSEQCPFVAPQDPRLGWFGVALGALYGALLAALAWDAGFQWPVERLRAHVERCVAVLRRRVRRVQLDQRRLLGAQERTEKQLRRSREFDVLVAALRGAAEHEDPAALARLAGSLAAPAAAAAAAAADCCAADAADDADADDEAPALPDAAGDF